MAYALVVGEEIDEIGMFSREAIPNHIAAVEAFPQIVVETADRMSVAASSARLAI